METSVGTVSELLITFRASVKRDAVAIRGLKAQIGDEQRSDGFRIPQLQSSLHNLRGEARARHVTYCLWKGRSWAEIEKNRPQGDPGLTYVLAEVWRKAIREAGSEDPPPSSLREHMHM